MQENIKTKTSSDTVLHEIAESPDKFIRKYVVCGNVKSIVLFDDQQLADIERFCCRDDGACSPKNVDTTFKFGNFYVVTAAYRHLLLSYPTGHSSGKSPVFMGPMMLTHKLTQETYRILFDSMAQTNPILANIKAFVTDGDVALAQACQ